MLWVVILGAILTGLCAPTSQSWVASGLAEGMSHRRSVVGAVQGCAVHLDGAVFQPLSAYVILKIIDVVYSACGSRRSRKPKGLDIALHDERGYNL
jgi:ammonia channel protein AmtB